MTSRLADRVRVIQGDITQLDVDAIVNAANETLLGGGGVDGAIHRAAGPELVEECRGIGGCPTGEARITKGYRLFAKHVIHTVGPIYESGLEGERELLRSCYEQSLRLAEQAAASTIAFPCISTGIYCFPKDEACRIATETVLNWLEAHNSPREVTFCCFSREDSERYHDELRRRFEADSVR